MLPTNFYLNLLQSRVVWNVYFNKAYVPPPEIEPNSVESLLEFLLFKLFL